MKYRVLGKMGLNVSDIDHGTTPQQSTILSPISKHSDRRFAALSIIIKKSNYSPLRVFGMLANERDTFT